MPGQLLARSIVENLRREDARLQHLVGRVADAGNDIGGREGGLLDLGETILRVPPAEFEDADFDQRIMLRALARISRAAVNAEKDLAQGVVSVASRV